MANKGKKGALECRARDWACALRWVRVRERVHVRGCTCACVCVFVLRVVVLVLVAFALMSSVKGHSLDWPWNGPVSRLCARADGTGAPWYMVSLALSAQNSRLRSKRFENKFGTVWAWNRSPAGRPGYPHGADA